MSLTTELDDSGSPTRRFLEERFPNTRRVTGEANALLRKAETIRPSSPLPWGTLGTAFDYRARYYFRVTPSKELVAWRGALAIGGPDAGWEDTDQYEFWDTDEPTVFRESPDSDLVVLRRFQGRTQRYTGTNIVPVSSSEPRQRDVIVPPELATDFFASLDETLARTGPEGRLLEPGDEELLARYCIVLALFEEFERPGATRAYGSSPLLGVGSAPTVDGLLGIAERHWVDDLCRLSEAFFHAFDGRFSGDAVLNPTFQGVNLGADADIIIDGCMMEFKTTVKATIEKVRGLYQLIGYSLLDYDDEYGIEKLGFYMARQGQVIEWPVADLFERLTGQGAPSLQELRRQFRDRITGPR